MGSICWSSPAESEKMTQRCGPRSAAVSRGLLPASTQHEIDLWKTHQQSSVALFGPRASLGRRRADRHPYLGPRLGYFVIRLLNLSLFKKCDPRIWIVVSLELIGIFQGGGIGRPDGFFAKAKTRLGMSTVKA